MGFGTKIPLILGPKHIGLQRPKLPEHLRGAAWELLGGMKKITVVLVVFFCFPIFPLFFPHHLVAPKRRLDRILGFQRVHVGSRMAPT